MNAFHRALRILTAEVGVVTWDQLVLAEPRLEQLRRQVTADIDRSWDAYADYKAAMCALVGWHAEDDLLPDWMFTPAAYDMAHAVILRPHW